MNIPNKVKIGAHEYQVLRRDDEGENDFRFGHCNIRGLKIYIDDRVSQSQQEETFFHEVLHAICDQVHAFPKSDDGVKDEEKLVQPIGHGFYQFLKENNLINNQ